MSDDIGQMSRPALIARIGTLQAEIATGQDELLKVRMMSAVKLDVIRLLAFQMNRDPTPDPRLIVPKDPAARKLIAMELEAAANHLIQNAESMKRSANTLRLGDDDTKKKGEDDVSPNVATGDSDPAG